MKTTYRKIKDANPGDEVLYKFGHRFKPENMAPCVITYSGKKVTSVRLSSGGDLVDKTNRFYVKHTEEYECPSCGEVQTGYADESRGDCFDCYANRSGMPT